MTTHDAMHQKKQGMLAAARAHPAVMQRSSGTHMPTWSTAALQTSAAMLGTTATARVNILRALADS